MMDVEINKDSYLPLVLVEGQVLLFSGNLLKYIDLFNRTYEMGFHSFHENKDFQIPYNLWRLTLGYLAEYDKNGLEKNNSWTRAFNQIEKLERYEMVRMLNYYGIPLVMDMALSWIVQELLQTDRLSLQLSHPLVEWRRPLAEFKSLNKRALTMDSPYAKINNKYAVRRQEIMAICQTYVKTMDILVIIEQDFLPSISADIIGVNKDEENDIMLISTSWGLAALGDNHDGQLGTGIENENWRSYGQPETAIKYGLTMEQTEGWRIQRLSQGEWIPVSLRPEFSIISVTTGKGHTIINTTHGLFGCGLNRYGQLGIPVNPAKDTVGQLPLNVYYKPVSLDAQSVLLVACGAYHSLVYTRKGLFAAGDNDYGQLGIKDSVRESSGFARVPFYEPLSAIVCGGPTSFLLTKANQVYMAGRFDDLEYASSGRRVFTHIMTETPIVAITASPIHALFLDERGVVYIYQAVVDEKDSFDETIYTLHKISRLPPIKSIGTHDYTNNFFIDYEGNVYTFNLFEQTYDDELRRVPIPHKVITMTMVNNRKYFVTCDGLIVEPEDDEYYPVNISLSDLPLCIDGMVPPQQQHRFACHQCGEHNYASLSYHGETQRVFCHTKTCLSDYKNFRLR